MIRPARHKMCFDAMHDDGTACRKPAQDFFPIFGSLDFTYVRILTFVRRLRVLRTYDFQLTRSKPGKFVWPLVMASFITSTNDDEQDQKKKNHAVCVIFGPPGRRFCHPGTADRSGIPRTRGNSRRRSVIDTPIHVPPVRLFFRGCQYCNDKAEKRSQPQKQQ